MEEPFRNTPWQSRHLKTKVHEYQNLGHHIPLHDGNNESNHLAPNSEISDRILRDSADLVNVSLYDFNNRAEGFIVDCRVAGLQCSYRDFQELRHPRYLRCFTFNHSLFHTAAKHWNLTEEDVDAGAALQLKLTLYTDSYPDTETRIDTKEDFFNMREFGGVTVQVTAN